MLNLYKSSAGSGKTFTLVKEYLKLCLPNPKKYRNIVAITFTNAASAEMKERILAKLQGLADGREDDLKNILLSEGLNEGDINNAGKVLENILRDYSRFNVSTIDSFFHKILRAFGKELGLPLDFEIFLETEDALDYAVDNFIQKSFNNPELHKILFEFIDEKISNGKSWQIRADLQKIARELLSDETFLMTDPSLEEIKKFIVILKEIVTSFEKKMDDISKRAMDIIQRNGLKTSDFKYGDSGPAGHFLKIARNVKVYEPGKRFQSGVSNPEEWVTKKSLSESRIRAILESDIMPLAQEVEECYNSGYSQYISAKEVQKNIYTFSVYEEIHKLLIEYKEKNEVVLIADFNRILADHLLRDQLFFIFSKIGARYDHFLIDEFQDTSTLQWLNLRPLIENAVAQGAECLLVGDSKQAIYRWRGGQVELIETIVTEIDFPDNSRKLSLNSNYRSRKEVVEFNNLFFREILSQFPQDFHERDLLDKIFSDVAQKPALKIEKNGYIEIGFIEKDGLTKEAFYNPASEKLLYDIVSLLGEGYNLRDITILVRNNSETEIVAQLLFSNNLDFISADSLFLDKSPAIRLLLSLLHYLSDTRNNLAKTELLHIYLDYFHENHGKGISEILNDFNLSGNSIYDEFIPRKFRDNVASLSSLPLYELLESLLSIFGLDIVPDPYIQRFREVVLEFNRKHKLSIRFFLEWWEESKYSVVMPDDMNAIKVMTIHKSKGLEFPVVMIPFAAWNFNSGMADILWVESEVEPFNMFEKLPVLASPRLAKSVFSEAYLREESMIVIDNLNLLYVAFTRARDRLYISTEKLKSDKEEINSVSRLMNKIFQNDLQSGRELVTFGSKA